MRTFSTLALGLLLAAAPAGAVSISFVPASISAAVGGQIAVDVVVGGLGDGAPPSLGSYDLDLGFDSSRLAFDSFDFGALLGGPAASLQSAGAVAGSVDVAEVSLLLPSALDALQGESVAIGTARFTVLAAGESEIAVGQAILGDGLGNPLRVGSAGSVRVNAGPAIPEPAAFGLFGLGALAVARVSRRRRS